MLAPREPQSLAGALGELLASPELRARMSENNRRMIQEFSPEVVAPEYLAMLREAVGSDARSGLPKPNVAEPDLASRP